MGISSLIGEYRFSKYYINDFYPTYEASLFWTSTMYSCAYHHKHAGKNEEASDGTTTEASTMLQRNLLFIIYVLSTRINQEAETADFSEKQTATVKGLMFFSTAGTYHARKPNVFELLICTIRRRKYTSAENLNFLSCRSQLRRYPYRVI